MNNRMRYPTVPRLLFYWVKIVLCPLALISVNVFAQAQTLPSTPATSQATTARVSTKEDLKIAEVAVQADQSEAVVVMSPFEVSADADTGYLARSSLAGTRIRTDLKDIAASVSVVTKDFITDVRGNNLEDLLVYTLGTEVGGMGGNFSGTSTDSTHTDFDSPLRTPRASTRIRGLSSADITQDFFPTNLSADTYNIDSIDISRGANAMLFGLGSPAGIINYNLIKAKTNKTATKIEQDFGSYGSNRNVLDSNQVLIKDKLAVRIATVYDKTYYRIRPAYVADQRMYLTATYRPFANTTLKVSTEWSNQTSNRPENRPPLDNYTWWWDVGKPTYDPTTGRITLLGTPKDPVNGNPVNPSGSANGNLISSIGMGTMVVGNIGIIYPDAGSSVPSLSGFSGVIGLRGGVNPGVHLNAAGTALVNDGMRSLADTYKYLQALHANDISKTFWLMPQMTDTSIWDFYHEQLSGPNKYEFDHWKTYNITLEQRFFHDRGGIELVFDRQLQDFGYNDLLNFFDNRILMDINTKLPNGAANPNFGRPVIIGQGYQSISASDQDVRRITGFYDLNLGNVGPHWLGKILGRHVFTATHSRQESYNENFQGRPFNTGIDYELTTVGKVGTASTDARTPAIISYVGPNMATASTPSGTGLQQMVGHWPSNLSSATVLFAPNPAAGQSAPSVWSTKSFSLISNGREDVANTARYATRSLSKIHSSSFVVQSHLLDDLVVGTIGWRNDQNWSYSAGGVGYEPTTGVAITDWSRFPLSPNGTTIGQSTFNWGAVGNLPAGVEKKLPFNSELSFLYNQASNFTPTQLRFDLHDNPRAPASGKTKEYGVRLSMFKEKFELLVTHYKTSSLQVTVNGFATPLLYIADFGYDVYNNNVDGINDGNPAGLAQWNGFLASPAGKEYLELFRYKYAVNASNGKTYVVSEDRRSSDVVGTGDVVATGWEYEAIFNPTKNWRITINANRAQAIRSNTAPDILAWLNTIWKPMADGPAGDLLADGNTIRGYFYGNSYAAINALTKQDGSPTTELQKWHWNAVTNYKFDRGLLKGVNVGGGIRWEDKAAIGFPVTSAPNVNPFYDVFHPYYAPALTNYDAWVGYDRQLGSRVGWRIQLNVRNIGVGNKLIPVSAQPDGSIAAYRIAEPMRWTLSNTFSF